MSPTLTSDHDHIRTKHSYPNTQSDRANMARFGSEAFRKEHEKRVRLRRAKKEQRKWRADYEAKKASQESARSARIKRAKEEQQKWRRDYDLKKAYRRSTADYLQRESVDDQLRRQGIYKGLPKNVTVSEGRRWLRLAKYFNSSDRFYKFQEWPWPRQRDALNQKKTNSERFLMMHWLISNGLEPSAAAEFASAGDAKSGKLVMSHHYDHSAKDHFKAMVKQAKYHPNHKQFLLRKKRRWYDMSEGRVVEN